MNRNHPIRQLLDDAAFTGKPRTAGDVDAALDRYIAGLTIEIASTKRSELRTKLLDAGAEIAGLRAEGSNQAARRRSGEIVEQLAALDWAPPADKTVDTTDPAELAKSVPRW